MNRLTSDVPSETFLGFQIVCNNFDDCRNHLACRNYRAWARDNYHSRGGIASHVAKRERALQ